MDHHKFPHRLRQEKAQNGRGQIGRDGVGDGPPVGGFLQEAAVEDDFHRQNGNFRRNQRPEVPIANGVAGGLDAEPQGQAPLCQQVYQQGDQNIPPGSEAQQP